MKKERLHLTTLLCLLAAVMLFITGCSADSDENPVNTSFTVTFNAGDGTFDDGKTTITKEVYDGEKVTEPTAPAKEGYSLVHWYAKSEDSPFDFENTPITCDITLYAKWAEGYAPDNLAAAIRALAENSAAKNVLLKASGTANTATNNTGYVFFANIRDALRELKDKAPDILVTLDLSDVRGLSSLSRGTFFSCTNLEGIIVPDSITSINENAFYRCTSLTSVTFTEKSQLTSIEDWAFAVCTSLTSVEIPEGVTSIEDSAFAGCTSLTNVTFAKNSKLTSIGLSAFNGCTSLTNVKIPEGVTNIDSGAFASCTSLTNVTFGKNSQLTSIGLSAFNGCTSLASVTFAENSKLTSIGGHAFCECTSLISMTIPASVTSIEAYAFIRCTSLASIEFADKNNWYVTAISNGYTGGEEINVTDATANATKLKTYSSDGGVWAGENLYKKSQ